MKVIVKKEMNYIEFLGMIQQVSTNSHAIQNKVIKQVIENHDICRLKNKLDRQIKHFDDLLSTKK